MEEQEVKLRRAEYRDLYGYTYDCPACHKAVFLTGDDTNYAHNGTNGVYTAICGHQALVPNKF